MSVGPGAPVALQDGTLKQWVRFCFMSLTIMEKHPKPDRRLGLPSLAPVSPPGSLLVLLSCYLVGLVSLGEC